MGFEMTQYNIERDRDSNTLGQPVCRCYWIGHELGTLWFSIKLETVNEYLVLQVLFG